MPKNSLPVIMLLSIGGTVLNAEARLFFRIAKNSNVTKESNNFYKMFNFFKIKTKKNIFLYKFLSFTFCKEKFTVKKIKITIWPNRDSNPRTWR